MSNKVQGEPMSPHLAEHLLCIDISGIVVRREPAGRGWQARVEGEPRDWSRGNTLDEAVGSLIRRLALEHEGTNWRREQETKATEETAVRSDPA